MARVMGLSSRCADTGTISFDEEAVGLSAIANSGKAEAVMVLSAP
jgi:hypothetical protein